MKPTGRFVESEVVVKKGSVPDRILEEALSQFLTKGYNAVSIREIIGPLGISKGGFYHHFGSKQTLFLAVVERVLGGWDAAVSTLLSDTSRSVHDRMLSLFLSPRERGEVHYGLLYEGLRVLAIARERTAEVVDGLIGHCEALLVEGQERGEIRDFLDCKSWAFQIAALVEGGYLLTTLGGVADLDDHLLRSFENTWRGVKALDL